eukprot:283663-Hanusia_phi.AAC.1
MYPTTIISLREVTTGKPLKVVLCTSSCKLLTVSPVCVRTWERVSKILQRGWKGQETGEEGGGGERIRAPAGHERPLRLQQIHGHRR